MKRLRFLCVLLMGLLCAHVSSAFIVDGIAYNKVSENEVEVTHLRTSTYDDNPYSGIITIPDSIVYNGKIYIVVGIGDDAFYESYDLYEVILPNTIEYIGRSAFDFSGLSQINLPSSLTTIGWYAFNLTCLHHIVIPNSVETIEEAAFARNYLKSATVSNSIKAIPTDMFYNCEWLTEVTFGNSVETIGSGAFAYCHSLTSLDLPNSLKLIDVGAFEICIGLKSVTIPNNVEKINNYAFSFCESLESLVIGKSVTQIGEDAFEDCNALKSIYSLAKVPPKIKENTFTDYQTPTLYVPYGCVQAYKKANYWKKFSKIVGLKKGDIDADGDIGINDVTELINNLLGDNTSDFIDLTGDVDGDGKIDINDVTSMIELLLDSGQTYEANGVTFKMIKVQAGTFTMGATAEQVSEAHDNEYPAHEVTLTNDYYIGQTEVTQELWQAVMGSNPSYFKGDPNLPVEWVTWDDCKTFISKLNEITGQTFRLPTEAEWEYAARGGHKGRGYKYAGSNSIDDVSWYDVSCVNVGSSSPNYGTHAVATKAPNELGLYDMSGNVWEICQDYFSNYDPSESVTGSNCVIRGGAWWAYAESSRVSRREKSTPSGKYNYRGFRLAL